MASFGGFLGTNITPVNALTAGYQGVAISGELDDTVAALQNAMATAGGHPPVGEGELVRALADLDDFVVDDNAVLAPGHLACTNDAERVALLNAARVKLRALMVRFVDPGNTAVDDAQVYLVIDNILLLLAENGSSGSFSPRGHFLYVNQNNVNCAISIKTALSCLKPTRREFFRACAQRTCELLDRDKRLTHWGKMHGIKQDNCRISFDCAELVSDLSPVELAIISQVKDAALTQAQAREQAPQNLLNAGFSGPVFQPPPNVNANLILGPRH